MDIRTQYFIAGIRPVYLERAHDGRVLKSFKLDWTNGEFIKDDEYASRILFNRIDEVEEVSEKEFWEHVHRLRQERGFF